MVENNESPHYHCVIFTQTLSGPAFNLMDHLYINVISSMKISGRSSHLTCATHIPTFHPDWTFATTLLPITSSSQQHRSKCPGIIASSR